jgi:Acetyltransferase (isoleucine patch superfamily)
LGFKRKIAFALVNICFCGAKPRYWSIKRSLLNWAGVKVGVGAKVVAPLRIFGDLEIGENTWVGTGLTIHGNGSVFIGNNCDIAPDVTFLTGSHEIGCSGRRAGKGKSFKIHIGEGTWIGARSTIMGNISIGRGCVVGASSLVNKILEDNVMVAGIPAKVIKKLN